MCGTVIVLEKVQIDNTQDQNNKIGSLNNGTSFTVTGEDVKW